MTRCSVTPITASKACSGKCKSNTCRDMPRLWVLTACEGMISLFERNVHGALAPIDHGGQPVFSSLDEFQKAMSRAEESNAFDQLIIVGSTSDIAWIHASLPARSTLHIAAEIEYPLLAAWFKQPQPMPSLTQALGSLLFS